MLQIRLGRGVSCVPTLSIGGRLEPATNSAQACCSRRRSAGPTSSTAGPGKLSSAVNKAASCPSKPTWKNLFQPAVLRDFGPLRSSPARWREHAADQARPGQNPRPARRLAAQKLLLGPRRWRLPIRNRGAFHSAKCGDRRARLPSAAWCPLPKNRSLSRSTSPLPPGSSRHQTKGRKRTQQSIAKSRGVGHQFQVAAFLRQRLLPQHFTADDELSSDPLHLLLPVGRHDAAVEARIHSPSVTVPRPPQQFEVLLVLLGHNEVDAQLSGRLLGRFCTWLAHRAMKEAYNLQALQIYASVWHPIGCLEATGQQETARADIPSKPCACYSEGNGIGSPFSSLKALRAHGCSASFLLRPQAGW